MTGGCCRGDRPDGAVSAPGSPTTTFQTLSLSFPRKPGIHATGPRQERSGAGTPPECKGSRGRMSVIPAPAGYMRGQAPAGIQKVEPCLKLTGVTEWFRISSESLTPSFPRSLPEARGNDGPARLPPSAPPLETRAVRMHLFLKRSPFPRPFSYNSPSTQNDHPLRRGFI